MDRKPNIIVTGMLDTKFNEIRFLADQVAVYGGNPVVMDLSLGQSADWADITREEVLKTAGVSEKEVSDAPRAKAIGIVGPAGAKKIMELYDEGKVDGVISWAGSVGTTTVTYVMRALPFGVPKIMLTDMASSDVSMWLGNKDIYIVNPTAEQGINIVTRKMLPMPPLLSYQWLRWAMLKLKKPSLLLLSLLMEPPLPQSMPAPSLWRTEAGTPSLFTRWVLALPWKT